MKALLKACAKIHVRDNAGLTPVMVAASNGHVGLVEAMVKEGASLLDVREDGSSFLHAAAAGGNETLVSMALNAGVASAHLTD